MLKNISAGLACAAFVVICSCTDPVSPMEAEKQYMQRRAEVVKNDVETIRGLPFLRPVHATVISREEYTASTKQSYSSSLSDIEDAALAAEYAQMCLMPETNSSIGAVLGEYYASFPIAFYRAGSDSLFLIPDPENDKFDIDVTIAHELTHALQDQYFHLFPTVFPEYSSYSSDAGYAIRAVVEGDASFVEALYAYRTLFDEYGMTGANPVDSAEAYFMRRKTEMITASYEMDEPVHLDVRSLMPYFVGPAYIARKYAAQHDWNTVNAIFNISAIPRSVAEINSGTPFEVVWFDFHAIQMLLAAAAGTIEFVDDDNAGFSLLHGLYYANDMVEAEDASDSYGWRGDRYLYVKRNGVAYGTLIWTLAFASEQYAEKCYSKFKKLVSARVLGGTTATEESLSGDAAVPDTVCIFNGPGVTTQLIKNGTEIWWLENTGELTVPIRSLLEERKNRADALAKRISTSILPVSLSAEDKYRVTERLLTYLLRKQ